MDLVLIQKRSSRDLFQHAPYPKEATSVDSSLLRRVQLMTYHPFG